MLYLAIDQHRNQLTINLRNENGDVLERRQVSTDWAKVRKFFEDVRERAAADGGFVTILEICGFNDWLVKLLGEYGCQDTVLVVTVHAPGSSEGADWCAKWACMAEVR